MIAYIEGQLLAKYSDSLVLVCGGVGYEVRVVPKLLDRLGAGEDLVQLHTYLVVREDEHSLYGFERAAERQLFARLLRVSGVGPRLALAMLATEDPDSLVAAIRGQDSARLSRIPGIGKRTAERLILDLGDRLQDWSYTQGSHTQAAAAPQVSSALQEAEQALLGLGYSPREIASCWQSIDQPESLSAAELIRQALKSSR